MEALGLLFVGTTLLLLVMQAAESLAAGARMDRSPEAVPELRALRTSGRTRLAIVAVE